METFSTNQTKWYHRWWGVVALGFLVMVGISVIAFGVLTVSYWWKIKQGKGDELAQQFANSAGGFTVAKNVPGVINNSPVDRKVLESENSPFLGRSTAPVTIVEFIDFKCPNCQKEAPIIAQVAAQYGQWVKIIVRNMPIEDLHPGAFELARLGVCANDQHRFWPLHDWLYQHQDDSQTVLTPDFLSTVAGAAQLDVPLLQTCLASNRPAQLVRADFFDGLRFGVRGTPTFFINGEKVEGVISWDKWSAYLSGVTH